MKPQISSHDFELLCVYVDGELKPKDSSRLESRLKTDAALREALRQIQMTKSILSHTPTMRAPRNFTLTPEMVGIHRKHTSPFWGFAFRTMQMSAVLSTLLLVFILIGDFLTVGKLGAPLLPAAAPLPKQEMALEEVSSPTSMLPATALPQEQAKALDTLAVATMAEPNKPQSAEKFVSTEMPEVAAAPPSAPVGEAAPMQAAAELEITQLPSTEAATVSKEIAAPLPTATLFASVQKKEISPKPTIETKTLPPVSPSWNLWRIVEVGLALIAFFSVIVALFFSKKR